MRTLSRIHTRTGSRDQLLKSDFGGTVQVSHHQRYKSIKNDYSSKINLLTNTNYTQNTREDLPVN